jgi:hypothetical protein
MRLCSTTLIKHVEPIFKNPLSPVALHGASVVFDSMYLRSSSDGLLSSSFLLFRAICTDVTSVRTKLQTEKGSQLTVSFRGSLLFGPYLLQRGIINKVLAQEAVDMPTPRVNA